MPPADDDDTVVLPPSPDLPVPAHHDPVISQNTNVRLALVGGALAVALSFGGWMAVQQAGLTTLKENTLSIAIQLEGIRQGQHAMDVRVVQIESSRFTTSNGSEVWQRLANVESRIASIAAKLEGLPPAQIGENYVAIEELEKQVMELRGRADAAYTRAFENADDIDALRVNR